MKCVYFYWSSWLTTQTPLPNFSPCYLSDLPLLPHVNAQNVVTSRTCRGRGFPYVSGCWLLKLFTFTHICIVLSPGVPLMQRWCNPHSGANASLGPKKSIPVSFPGSSLSHSHALDPKKSPHQVVPRAGCYVWSLCLDPGWALTTGIPEIWPLAQGSIPCIPTLGSLGLESTAATWGKAPSSTSPGLPPSGRLPGKAEWSRNGIVGENA